MQQRFLDFQNELEQFFGMISPGLKLEVFRHIFNNVINKNELFQNNKSLIKFIIDRIETEIYMPESNVILQNDDAHHLYFISSGFSLS